MKASHIILALALLTSQTSGFVPLFSIKDVPVASRTTLTELRAQYSSEESESTQMTTSLSNNSTVPTAVSDFSSSTNTASAVLTPPEDKLSLWQRRLITSEDPFSIHKLSSIIFTLSGAGILATAAVRFAMGPEIFSEIPQELFIPTYVFSISNLVMCLVSIRMAFLHRRYDLTARNAFLGTAASSLFSGFYYLWTNPLGPDIFNDQRVTQACFATLVALNLYLILDTCFRVSDVVEGRRDRKSDDETNFFVDALSYVFPVAWGLPFVLATGWVDAVLYNREWFMAQCQYIDQQIGSPGMLASLCYLQVLASFGPAMGSLFVTLRDKKLISRDQEIAGITVFSVPALIWTISVTATFFSYMTWPE